MAGAFRNRRANCPRANDTYEHTYIRNNPLVPTKLSNSPLFVHYGNDRFTEILVQESVVDLAGRHSTVFFIATDQGRIFKVIKNAVEAEAQHVSSVKAVEASSPIVSLTAHIERRPNQQTARKLLILTPTQVSL
ncbi:hypothetical protein OESDEN_16443 [Oesophagostomum dentatum]|uniref:Sema domain-containing protein n=1 Tax=Oesophagostomum dentatum TaxID=61180 RepID=A0A0B1SJY8_OESDE|nr:hypothetical protein OESDEN_16443 [Oesophagostomum dentatum]